MNISISLPPALVNFIKAKIATGRYGSTGEVVREPLRVFEREEMAREQLKESGLERRREVWRRRDARDCENQIGGAAVRQVHFCKSFVTARYPPLGRMLCLPIGFNKFSLGCRKQFEA